MGDAQFQSSAPAKWKIDRKLAEMGGFGAPNFKGRSPPNFGPNFYNYTYIRPSEL